MPTKVPSTVLTSVLIHEPDTSVVDLGYVIGKDSIIFESLMTAGVVQLHHR